MLAVVLVFGAIYVLFTRGEAILAVFDRALAP